MKIKMLFSGILTLIFLSGASIQSFSQDKKETQVFTVVEEMPKFEGKDIKHFNKWVLSNVKYPKEALEAGISGKVFASFVVAKDGTVQDVKIKKDTNKLLDDEVLRVVKSSPKWTPGKQKGKAVAVSITIPVTFKLSL
jgi:TonB family protein